MGEYICVSLRRKDARNTLSDVTRETPANQNMMSKMFENVDEMVNSQIWRKVRSSNETELNFDDLFDVLEYINAGLTAEEAAEDHFLAYEMIDKSIDQVVNQWS